MVDPTPIRKDLFGTDKETDAPNDAFDASSVKNALAWGHKFYATVTNEGSFFILNRRLPGKVSFMTRKNFIDSLEDKQLIITHEDGKAKKVPFTELWLKDPSTDKNRYLGVVFDPSPTFDKKSNMLNLWDGFATKPKKGNCPLTLTYIKDIISSQDEIMNTWILDFLAHMVQKPWEKPEVALLLKGAKGVGKTFFLDLVKALIDGKKRHLHCFKTSDSENIYGTYRAQLLNLIGLLLEEVTWGGDRKNESSLKDITSGKTITINIKWGPTITVSNLMRIIMAANPGWSVPASYDERRFAVSLVSADRQKNHRYFAAIQEELDSGGLEALMHELMNRDISKFNCREAPMTEGLLNEKIDTMSHVERWWLGVLRKGQIPFIESEKDKVDPGWVVVYRDALYNEYLQAMKAIGVRVRLLQGDEFGSALRALVPKREDDGKGKVIMGGRGKPDSIIGTKRPGTAKEKRSYAHVIPPLALCRNLMDVRENGNLEWSDPTEWEQPEPRMF